MSDDSSGRVKLNLRVDTQIKRAFEDRVHEKYGQSTPYAGFELENELRYFLDEGPLAELESTIKTLHGDSYSATAKEKNLQNDRNKTIPVCYRISSSVRRKLLTVVDDGFRSPGKLVEQIMIRYATQGCTIQRLIGDIESLEPSGTIQSETSDDAVTRRKKEIADYLFEDGLFMFDMADFRTACDNVDSISSSDYIVEKYLPKVLDEMGFTWDSSNKTSFVNKELADLEPNRDVTKKPYFIMDDDDKKLAIKVELYRSLSGRRYAKFGPQEAVDALQGRPDKSTVRRLMTEIGAETPGYRYDNVNKTLKVNRKHVKSNKQENIEIYNIISRN